MSSRFEHLSFDIHLLLTQYLDPPPQPGIIAFPFDQFSLACCSRYLYAVFWEQYAVNGGVEGYLKCHATSFPLGACQPQKGHLVKYRPWQKCDQIGKRVKKTRLRHIPNQTQVRLLTNQVCLGLDDQGYFANEVLNRAHDSLLMHYITHTRWLILVEGHGVCWIAWGRWYPKSGGRCETFIQMAMRSSWGDPWQRWSHYLEATLVDYQCFGKMPL
ncbi:hypothetical protein TWF106_010685 [Orbilia oligospora]|uniref:Uncharacterized protein n=1 Tax=Orbilia oligospora TaxID=2813651 RepID=A0A7C8UI92_ORBOL|nr:hypothetical protein TWF106_010685 [Orbilia oligospora]